MERGEFLRLMGMGAGMAVLGTCLQGCKKQQASPPVTVDLTLDLSQPSNSALNSNGGYLVMQGVIVARTLAGSYIAVASACTHQGVTVQYAASAHQFHCPGHGANFSETGTVQNGPATTDLQQMHTSLTGQSLHVYS